MKCPKCQGDAVEIRGNYYCSQCGETVDLDAVKQNLENKMEKAKEKAMHVQGDGVSLENEKSNSANNVEVKETVVESIPEQNDFPEPGPVSTPMNNVSKNIPEPPKVESAQKEVKMPPQVDISKPEMPKEELPTPVQSSPTSPNKTPSQELPKAQPKEVPVSPAKPEPSPAPPKAQPVELPKKEMSQSAPVSPGIHKKTPNNHLKKAVRLRILLIAVIILNILIVSGIIYLLVLR